jgi:hypothetical protein
MMTTNADRDPSNPPAVRRVRADADLSAILELGRRALGWVGGEDDARLFQWKHLENPFGESPMWVAVDHERVVGLRAFLRWELRQSDGGLLAVVRAVDTATDPAYQGRGIFTKLTLGTIDELRNEDIDLIFNTPNPNSLPGYQKMGWSVVGRLPTAVMLTSRASLRALAKARKPADRWSIEIRVGERASEVFADREATRQLLSTVSQAGGLATVRTPEYLAWRYGFEPLRYRVVASSRSPSDGLVVFRLRRRGSAVEAVVCEVLTPDGNPRAGRELLRSVAELTGADYLICLRRAPISSGPLFRVPGVGPILACRPLGRDPAPASRSWALTMGDVELF